MTFNEAEGSYQPAHGLANVYLTYDAAGGAWSISFYVRNLGNTGVLANAQTGPAGLETADIGPPRTFGLQFSARLRR